MLCAMTTQSLTPQRRVTAAVIASGRSGADVARHIGIPRKRVYERLHNRSRWQLAEAAQLADLLGVSLDALVRGGDQ